MIPNSFERLQVTAREKKTGKALLFCCVICVEFIWYVFLDFLARGGSWVLRGEDDLEIIIGFLIHREHRECCEFHVIDK